MPRIYYPTHSTKIANISDFDFLKYFIFQNVTSFKTRFVIFYFSFWAELGSMDKNEYGFYLSSLQ